MGIIVTWDTPQQTTLRWDIDINWAWTDIFTASVLSDTMIKSEAHTVDIILNGELSLPPQFDMIEHIQHELESLPPNTGRIIIAGGFGFASIIEPLLLQHYADWQDRIFVTDSLKEARSILAMPRLTPAPPSTLAYATQMA